MAIQDIDRADITLPVGNNRISDPSAEERLAQLTRAYTKLAKEVVSVHNALYNFPVAIGNALTSIAVVLPAPMPDALYFVGTEMGFNNGGTWITAKTTTGFTLNWATVTVGAQAARIGIIG